jgi:hypothetical protein
LATSSFVYTATRHFVDYHSVMECSYGSFCITPGGRVPTILCGGHECINKLHHFCQADFESSQESIIGTVESMFKRCLTCLLKEQGCFNPETCERLGYRISASGSLVMSASATPAVGSQRSSSRSTEVENAIVGLPIGTAGTSQEQMVIFYSSLLVCL